MEKAILESFIDFIQFKGITAEEITKVILQKLSEDGLNIEDCRGQNAATMAGIHNGVQQRIRNVNPKAEFVACTNHSLNLAGVHAAEETINSITFFGTVEIVYSFFSSSTHRWDILQAFAPKRVKRIVQTRWSARNNAVSVLCNYFPEVLEVLEKLTGAEENFDTRSGAGILRYQLKYIPIFLSPGIMGEDSP